MPIQPYLPVQRGNVRVSNLTVINAILFVTENGCKWRALPLRFGKWYKVYTRMHCWADAGVLDRLFNALQDHHMIRVSVDCLVLGSTSIKVHPDSAGAPKKRPASDWKISLRMKQW
jgi:transposase